MNDWYFIISPAATATAKNCHVFAIAAGDIIKYQGGHMMRNADARTVRSLQETFNSNGGHDAWFGDFKLQITSLFMVRNIKCGYLVFLVRTRGTRWDQIWAD